MMEIGYYLDGVRLWWTIIRQDGPFQASRTAANLRYHSICAQSTKGGNDLVIFWREYRWFTSCPVKSSNGRSVAPAKLSPAPAPPPPPNRLPSINLKSWLWPFDRRNHLETENLNWRISTQTAKLGRWLSTARRNFAKAGALISGANHTRLARPRSLLPLLDHDYTSKNMY